MGEGKARLRLEVGFESRAQRAWVKIWFLEPVEGTPEEVRRKWEEVVKKLEEEFPEYDDWEIPAWLAYTGRVRRGRGERCCRLEVVLPKGFYYAEVYARDYAPAGFKFRLTGDVEVSIELLKREGRDDFYYMGTYYPRRSEKEAPRGG
uniref:Uncharacterized protein n=1 Tax=Thermofilum pendens TaxID=2269 RepID=A0A7C4D2H4_THEPE